MTSTRSVAMYPIIPPSLSVILLVSNAAIAIVLWRILAAGVSRSGLAPASARLVRLTTAAFVFGWLGAALLLAPGPASLAQQSRYAISPLIPWFNLLPLAIVGAAITLSPAFRRVLASVPLPSLIAIQFYRALGVVFIILLGLGQLPAHFALPAGWGDIVVGLTAPLVAVAMARSIRGARALAIGWNVIGLLDLVVAVGMGTGVLVSYLAPELGSHVPPAAAMGIYPMILVPTFAVPLSIILHLIALGRLRQVPQPSRGVVSTPARR